MLELDGSGAEPLEDEDPRWIGPIPLIGRLGAGGMGRVYLGVHEGRYAAVKQVLPSVVVGEDKEFLRRFGHELDNLARLPGEATAPLFAGDRDARPPWFATAYVPGLTLTEALEVHGGPLPAGALWLLLREAAKGLVAVHALDMVHRDLKPSNVMLTLDGLTLIDFGVARAADQSQLTKSGVVVGTPAYMSPEQASGKRTSTGVVDVFALGSVLAYAASGRPPFGDESGPAVLYRIVHEEPDLQPLRDLDAELADVVARCLDKDYEGRPTAADLLDLAEVHGPYEPPLWPEAVTERLAERAAFVTKLPETADLPVPEPGPEPDSTDSGGGNPKRPRDRRRTRVFVGVVPIVLATGVTLAVQLLPYASHDKAEAETAPSPSVSAPLDPTAPPSESAKKRPSPSASPSDGKGDESEKNGKNGKDGKDGAGGENGSGGAGRGGGAPAAGDGGSDSGSGGAGGAGGSGGSGDSGSSGGASDSGGSSMPGGSSGSGDSPSGGGSDDTGTPSGTFALKNGGNGKCLIPDFTGWAATGSCSAASASWSFKSASDGTVKVVNNSTGMCLTASFIGQVVTTESCAPTGFASAVLWRTGSGGVLKSVFNDGCLARADDGHVRAQSCSPGTASQRWTRT
ncbi:protein kinase [Streptomyces sp. MMCC 100]|uniref:protein kinase domain-containing protein n=1 Tax=Streptomyces sp. MMCC 100 TaxID=3163555 RepID=UPI003597B6A9